jgi:hypothetical protein
MENVVAVATAIFVLQDKNPFFLRCLFGRVGIEVSWYGYVELDLDHAEAATLTGIIQGQIHLYIPQAPTIPANTVKIINAS